MGFFMLS